MCVFGLLQAVELQARLGRVELEVEGCCFDSLLLLPGQSGQTIGECVGDAKFHRFVYPTPQTPSSLRRPGG